MKIIRGLEQGTNGWLEFRSNRITATDAAVVMGLNPWKTRIDLWQEKTLGWEKTFSPKETARMVEGTRMEPIARQAFIDQIGLLVEPAVAEHSDYPFLSASFDGLSSDGRIVEIKCGQKSHYLAKDGIVNNYYICQMMHQMLVSGGDEALFWSYYDGEGILMEFKRDDEFIEKMLVQEIIFWNNVQTFTQPELNYDAIRII